MSTAFALQTDSLKFEEKKLHVPDLQELRTVLETALAKNFAHAEVQITACPDLTAATYGLKGAYLGGAPTLVEAGGVPYLLPLVQREKLYNVQEIVQKVVGSGQKFMAVGAGAGPYPLIQQNCEGMYNIAMEADGTFHNGTYIAHVSGEEEKCVLQQVPHDEPRCAVLLNLFVSHNEPGNIIKIVAKQRTGSLNFIETLRQALEQKYAEKVVGMGGLFLLKNGKAHQHVMRDFSKTPIKTDHEVNQWLKFYEMPAQLNAVGTFVTKEHDLDLRLTHFHSFSHGNVGGHYHYDTTPDTVEYEAYLNVAERVVRVDQPTVTHKVGRD